MPQEAKFDIVLKPPGQQNVRDHAGVTGIESVNGVVIPLTKIDTENGPQLKGAIDDFGGEGDTYKFVAIHAEKYQAKVCGKDEDAIRFRINGEDGKWRLLNGPRLFINQPGHELIPEKIEFEGLIELIDLNADEDEQKVQVFVTYGKGEGFGEQKLPTDDLSLCQPCATEPEVAIA